MQCTENINGLKLLSIIYWKEGRKVGRASTIQYVHLNKDDRPKDITDREEAPL